MEADRCSFHKRTRGLPRSRQEPQRTGQGLGIATRAALDRGQPPATRGVHGTPIEPDNTSEAAKAAVAASLVSRMAFVFPERVIIWLGSAVAVHCLREVCRPGGIGAARSTANYCSGMAYLRRHLFKKGPNDIDPPGIKEASIIRSSTGRRDEHDVSQPTAMLGAGRYRAARNQKASIIRSSAGVIVMSMMVISLITFC